MKKIALAAVFAAAVLSMDAADTVFVKSPQLPILIERHDNVLAYMRIRSTDTRSIGRVALEFDRKVRLSDIQSVKLYYGGTDALQDESKGRFAPVEYISRHNPANTLSANRSYSVLRDSCSLSSHKVTLKADQHLFPGLNFFWISIQMKPQASLQSSLSFRVTSVSNEEGQLPLRCVSPRNQLRRMGIGVRHAGNDGSSAFRIPGLVTTNKGTLLGVYDVRYNSAADLQEHVDIGLSRSTDGGRTWEKMRLPLSFGENEGLPKAQNGVGDPCILVDTKTNTVWVVAAWTHGMGNQRAWRSSHPGMSKHTTAQLVMTRSVDDGKTWSAPVNITSMVKQPEWHFLLQGPGRGITMSDGTLVFPIQYIDKTRIPNAGIMYSQDGGESWTIHRHARTNTTESQVAEVEPGVLMLNMRDNRGGSRAVYTTSDLGRTWKEHESSRTALREPVCMASLISVKAEDNVLGKDLLIFSNPDSTTDRKNITIKVSTDGGYTWPYSLLLDEGYSAGYSCLSMIDKETVGILYESSVAHITFQAVKLTDIVHRR